MHSFQLDSLSFIPFSTLHLFYTSTTLLSEEQIHPYTVKGECITWVSFKSHFQGLGKWYIVLKMYIGSLYSNTFYLFPFLERMTRMRTTLFKIYLKHVTICFFTKKTPPPKKNKIKPSKLLIFVPFSVVLFPITCFVIILQHCM